MRGRVGGCEGKGTRGKIMQGLGRSLGKTHGALLPGTKYVLSKHETLSLILGAGKPLGVLLRGAENENLVFRVPWLAARCGWMLSGIAAGLPTCCHLWGPSVICSHHLSDLLCSHCSRHRPSSHRPSTLPS